jgi:hypothetical protein
MEKEISDLRQRLATYEKPGSNEAYSSNHFGTPQPALLLQSANTVGRTPHTDRDGVANSLLELRRGGGESEIKQAVMISEAEKRLGNVVIQPDQINALFEEYFRFYHPFLPVLDPERSADFYFDLCPLLFWTVVLVAARRYGDDPMLFTGLKDTHEKLVWSTVAAVPQNYLVVKALAIICTWPSPTSSTSTDQTFIMSGLMRQIALQTGLHRPSHVQDFMRNKIELREEDIQDRLRTWAICNIVSQTVSTAYGQPSETLYDWTLTTIQQPNVASSSPLDTIYWSLQIERFVDKVSRKFYNNSNDPLGVSGDQERSTWISLLIEDYRQLENQIMRYGTNIEALYLRAAGLHLRLSAFFDSISSPNYITDLLELYNATAVFLRAAFDLETTQGYILKYASRHIVMMILAGGFTLLKLLNSFFARHIDVPISKSLFSNTIRGIRTISISNNDLPARLAEVLAQLWHSYGAGMRPTDGPVDSSLQLRVRSRMSMSLIYDSVWRWREEFQFKGDGTTSMLDSAVNNPTQPDVSSANNSGMSSRNGSDNVSATDIVGENAMQMPTSMIDPSMTDGMPSSLLNESFIDHDYNLFDPLAFMLDAPTDFMGEDWMNVHLQTPFG